MYVTLKMFSQQKKILMYVWGQSSEMCTGLNERNTTCRVLLFKLWRVSFAADGAGGQVHWFLLLLTSLKYLTRGEVSKQWYAALG